MTDAERAKLMAESIDLLKTPLADAEPQPEMRGPSGLPLRSSREQDEWVAWHRQRADAREAATRELRRQSKEARDNAASADIASVICLVDMKFDECGKMILEGATVAREAAEQFAEQIVDLKSRVRTLELELTRAHTAAADARVVMVELRGQLVDTKADWIARLDALSSLLHKAVADAAALRSVEDNIGRRLDGLKLVN
jgi:hypothetical protein